MDRLDFDKARAMLRVWIRPDDTTPESGPDQAPRDRDSRTSRPLADGLRVVLGLEVDGSIEQVGAELVDAWGRPVEELFELGLANVRAQGKPEATLLKGSDIRALSGPSPSVSSWLLALDDLFTGMPDDGGLAAVPESHMFLVMPILDASVAETIGPLIALVDRLYQRGSLPTSSNLYWWRGRQLTLIPSRITDKGVEFTPPDELVDVVNRLLEKASGQLPG